jgi:hypothetical protein
VSKYKAWQKLHEENSMSDYITHQLWYYFIIEEQKASLAGLIRDDEGPRAG